LVAARSKEDVSKIYLYLLALSCVLCVVLLGAGIVGVATIVGFSDFYPEAVWARLEE